MADLSSQALQELRQQLNAAVTQAGSTPRAVAAAAGGAPADFCSAYQTAKPIFQAAATLLPVFLPGLGTTIAAAIMLLCRSRTKPVRPHKALIPNYTGFRSGRITLSASSPRLSRASTSFLRRSRIKTWMAGTSPGHDSQVFGRDRNPV